jgi:hypothetical protein
MAKPVTGKSVMPMQFGDRVGDFVSVLSNTEAARTQGMAPYMDWIGTC